MYRQAQLEYLLEGIFSRSQWHLGIEFGYGAAQAFNQDHSTVMIALRAFAIMSDIWPIQVRVAHLLKPAEGFLFQLVFGHSASPPVFSSPASFGLKAAR
ncbi:hypothetical protein D3C86_1934080 [compost metagenome]